MTIRTKFLACLLAFAVLPTAVIGIVSMMNAKRTIERIVETHLNVIADREQLRIAERLQADRDLLRAFTARDRFRLVLQRYLMKPNDADLQQMTTALVGSKGTVSRVISASIISLDGTVVVTTDVEEQGRSYTGKEFFERGKTEEVLDEFFHLQTGSGGIGVHLSAPLLFSGATVGVLHLQAVADYLNVNVDTQRFGDTGETVISRRLPSGDALILTPLRFDPQSALRRIVPRNPDVRPAAKIFDTHQPYFFLHNRDYRDKDVIAAVRFIPDPGWAVAVKIDSDEAFAGMIDLRHFITILLVIILCISGFCAYVISQIPIRRIERLQKIAHAIATGDLTARNTETKSDEIGKLAENIDHMASRLQQSHADLEKRVMEKTIDLRQANAFLDSIIENIPNMIFLKDAKELRFVRFNKAGEELLGYSRRDLIGKNDYDFFPKDQADAFTAKDRSVLEGGILVDIPEEPIDTRMHGRRILHTRKIPILDVDGKPLYLLGISEDITEQRHALEEIQKFQKAVLSSTDGIVITDPQMNILFVNPAWEKLNGFTASEVVNKPVRILKTDQTKPEVFEAMRAAMQKCEPFRSDDFINCRKDGTTYNAQLTVYPVRDEKGGGPAAFFVGINRDVTSRLIADNAKKRFVSLASHQLRTPLTIVRWALSQLRTAPELTADTQAIAEKAYVASRQMAETINVMLQLAQINEQSLQPQAAETRIHDLLKEVIAMQEHIMKRRRIRIDMHCPQDLTLVTDATFLREAVANIVNNACKYSALGGVVTVTAATGPDGIHITVQDHGCGIPKNEQDKMGTIFFRAANVLDREESGAGIGLHLVYALTQLLQGTVTVTSAENAGMTIVLSLPPLSSSALSI